MTFAAQPETTSARSSKEELIEVAWEGMVAGLLGYATVALLVGLIDVAVGRSFFYTASVLGQSLFYGSAEAAQPVVSAGHLLAYNGLHLLSCLAIGTSAAWLAYMAEHGPELWYVGVILLLAVAVAALGVVLILTRNVRGAIPVWMVVVPTVAGMAVIAGYVLGVRPRLRTELQTWRD